MHRCLVMQAVSLSKTSFTGQREISDMKYSIPVQSSARISGINGFYNKPHSLIAEEQGGTRISITRGTLALPQTNRILL